MALTPKQQRFVTEFLLDANGAAAAVRAGYSQRTAKQQASRLLLTNDDVQRAIAQAQRQRAERLEVTTDEVVRRLAAVAFADPRDLVQWTNTTVALRSSDEVSDDAVMAVAEVAEGQHGVRIRLHDRVRALRLLGDHLGLWDGRGQQADPAGLASAIRLAVQGGLELSGGPAGQAAFEPEDAGSPE